MFGKFIAIIVIVVILLIAFLVWIGYMCEKDKKAGLKWLNEFGSFEGLKRTNPVEYANRCWLIIQAIEPGVWEAIRVKPSKHGKGWFVEGELYSSKRFWPSSWVHGEEHYPTSYLSREDAEQELLNVLERMCRSIIADRKAKLDFENRRED
jgi:hypothetical protein